MAGTLLGQIANNLIAAALMIVLAVLSFSVTVFVVDASASLAGYDEDPSASSRRPSSPGRR